MALDAEYMRLALRLAKRALGATSPNPLVGAVLVKQGQIVGRGWHRRAGEPHAEIEAMRSARYRGHDLRGTTLYVTLEPCCTSGRTPPCTDAIIGAGIHKVVVGATDPNPRHAGRGLRILRNAGILLEQGPLGAECERLNEPFNFWIQHRLPFVTVKAAMTLDGKIATESGESKWITGEVARAFAMRLRQHADAVLVGIRTILADDPSLTFRKPNGHGLDPEKVLRRIILDSQARTPLNARIVNDANSSQTTVVVSREAPERRRQALARRVHVVVAPTRAGRINLQWVLKWLGAAEVTSLLVEGGGEVNASFLLGGLAQRLAFFYAPKILGGANARKAVAGDGARNLQEAVALSDVQWRKLGADWLLSARVIGKGY